MIESSSSHRHLLPLGLSDGANSNAIIIAFIATVAAGRWVFLDPAVGRGGLHDAPRDHTFLGMTQSLCPECLAPVPAKIITKGKRVYFRSCCRPTESTQTSSSDVSLYDQMQYSLPESAAQAAPSPTKVPIRLRALPSTSIPAGLVEMTSSCNLQCPMCMPSGPGGT